MRLTISAKGRIVIPAELRKKYNLYPGRAVQVVDYGGVLALVPALDDPIHQSAGMLYEAGDSLTEVLLTEHARERSGTDQDDGKAQGYPAHERPEIQD